MNKYISAFLKSPNPWILTFITVFILTPLSTVIVDLFQKKTIFMTLINVLSKIYKFVIDISVIQIKINLLLLIGICLLVLFIIFFMYKKIKNTYSNSFEEDQINTGNSQDAENYLSYKTDKFTGNIYWEWDYRFNNVTNTYHIINLRPICPKCQTPLIINQTIYSYSANCPRCKFNVFEIGVNKYSEYQLERQNNVEAVITDNINKKKTNEKNF